MEEMPGEPFRQNPTSGSQDVRRVHRTVAGDTLASVAYSEYGDPTQWRALAAYNGIDDPMRVRTGTALLLPVPEELVGVR
jgi:nucleoid-associated protein YgaU